MPWIVLHEHCKSSRFSGERKGNGTWIDACTIGAVAATVHFGMSLLGVLMKVWVGGVLENALIGLAGAVVLVDATKGVSVGGSETPGDGWAQEWVATGAAARLGC